MKKIVAWLEENKIEYSQKEYGNPYYFNDGFSVCGIQVSFFFDGIGNAIEKKNLLLKFMGRKKSYVCKNLRFGAGYTYTIMNAIDAERLEQHENKIKYAVEKFWEEEHDRRIRENKII